VTDCLFCSIVAGDIPATIVYETPDVVAFRDIQPQAPTHVLVIPREHYANMAEIAEVNPTLVAWVMRSAIAVAEIEGLTESGYRLVANTGAGAGQSVFHAHVHVIGGRSLNWPPG
jgi:histidine triad (HIT) family protein